MDESTLELLVRSVLEISGLVIPPQRFDALEEAARSRSRAAAGGDLQQYLRRVSSDAHEALALAEALTIGETYFFRHWPDFAALADLVLPGLFERERLGGAPPRLWSAACSTGEEAYSLALLVRSMEPRSRALVVGTDLNVERIARARAGAYGDWSFRGAGGDLLEGQLEPAGDKQRVIAEVRRAVSFAQHNLLSDSLPPGLLPASVDVVFLRNVLIYFDRPSARRVIEKLSEALVPGGTLVVSSVEASLDCFAGFEWQPSRSCAFYSKSGPAVRAPSLPAARSASQGPPLKPSRERLPELPAIRRGAAGSTAAGAIERTGGGAPSSPSTRSAAALLMERAARERRTGDGEGLARASRLAIEAARLEPLSPAPALLAALALVDLGDPVSALPVARKAASLAPGDPVAQLALARALEGAGHAAASRVVLRAAADAAARLPPNQPLEGAGGLTARALLAGLTPELEGSEPAVGRAAGGSSPPAPRPRRA